MILDISIQFDQRQVRRIGNHLLTYHRPWRQSLEINVSDSTIFCQMHIQPFLIISHLPSRVNRHRELTYPV